MNGYRSFAKPNRKPEAITPANKCGVLCLAWPVAIISRSYSRDLALQLNFT
jgi:hypothetical protein